jgi:hypothetical protein
MSSPKALASFRDARPEIAELIRTSRSQADAVEVDRRMSSQENHLRQVAVALVAALQSYITELVETKADELGDSWATLGQVQKRYVSVQTMRRLTRFTELFPESGLAEENKVDQLHAAVQDCAGWHHTPSLLARSAYREKLDGFLTNNGTKAIDRAISQFGNCGLSFFNWLLKNCPRYRGIPDLLDNLIALRNDVAHGIFNRRLTLREARIYRAAVYRLVSKIEEYQKPV